METATPAKKRRGIWFWIIVLAITGVAVWLLPVPEYIDDQTGQEKDYDKTTESMPANASSKDRNVTVYSASAGAETLTSASIKINGSSAIEDQIRDMLTHIFKPDNVAESLFPSGMSIENIFMYGNIAVISLDGEFRRKMNTGTWTELLAVYSIVNTLTAGFDKVEQVQILIDDSEADVFVSHILIDKPLGPDTSYIEKES